MYNPDKKLRFNFKIWLETEDSKGILGYGQMRLLEAIKKTGTMNEAMKIAGFNYRKSWEKLKKIESLLGFKIIHTHRGGIEKGNTVLTEKGILLTEAFEEFKNKYENLIKEACETSTSELVKKLSKIL